MTDLLNITKTTGRITILHFDGYLDGQTEMLAVESAQAVLNAGTRFLLIDLSQVDMITSAGLRALHGIYKIFTPLPEVEAWNNQHPGESFKSPYFKLSDASFRIQQILSMTGFLENIDLYQSTQDALDSFSK